MEKASILIVEDESIIALEIESQLTASKESDLGMIIPDSSLKNSSLGKAFFKVQSANHNEIVTIDFAHYEPSGGVPAAFIMAQMKDSVGILIL